MEVDYCNILNQYFDKLIKKFKTCTITETKTKEKRRYTHETSQKGSCVYILLNKKGNAIYVGESGVSVCKRLYLNGSGSHKEKVWFDEVDKVMYYYDDGMDWSKRLFIESVLIMKFKPCYNQKGRPRLEKTT